MPAIMLCWGVFTIAHAWIKSNGMLIAFRLLIGMFEAGFYPTACFYLSTFYTRYDLAIRIGLFYGMYAIAGAFSGAIAYGIFQINGTLYGWQYLFIIGKQKSCDIFLIVLEGSLTGFMAILCLLILPSGPSTAKFLSKQERLYAARRMQIDSALSEESKITKKDIIETLKDWKLWYVLVFNILASVPPQAFGVFLPLVVKVSPPLKCN
jgi:MFS family permease